MAAKVIRVPRESWATGTLGGGEWPEGIACRLCEAELPPCDRLPLDAGFAHGACVLAAWANLENVPHPAHNTEGLATDTNERSNVRTPERSHARAAGSEVNVPRPSEQLIDRMRTQGFVTAQVASEMTGHPKNTLYAWVARGRLKAMRSGHLVFVSLESLQRCVPSLKTAKGGAQG